MASGNLRAKGRGLGGYQGMRVGEATNPGPDSTVDVDSIADSDFALDPELQWALQDGAVDRRGLCPELDQARPPAPPELEELATKAQARLQTGIRRLRRQGIPADRAWSATLVPIMWLSLPVYCLKLLLPAMVREAVDLRPARRLASFWQRQGVQLPGDLSAWMHGRDDMGRH